MTSPELSSSQQVLPQPAALLTDPSQLLRNPSLLDTYSATPVVVMQAYLDQPGQLKLPTDSAMETALQIPEVQEIVLNRILGPEAKVTAVREVATTVGVSIADALRGVPSRLEESATTFDTVLSRIGDAGRLTEQMQGVLSQHGDREIDIEQLRHSSTTLSRLTDDLATEIAFARSGTLSTEETTGRDSLKLQGARQVSERAEMDTLIAEGRVDDDPRGAALLSDTPHAVVNRSASSVEDHEALCRQDCNNARVILRDTDETLGTLVDTYQTMRRRMIDLGDKLDGVQGVASMLGDDLGQLRRDLQLYNESGYAMPQIKADIGHIHTRLMDLAGRINLASEPGKVLRSDIDTAQLRLHELSENELVQQYT